MAQETKNKLTQLLCQRIDQQGPLTIADFMYEALQHPKYGYYNRPHVLGQKGDFVTAPEISQIFGELIGLWMLERWQSMGEPQSFSLIELGPGRGTLLCDLLRAAQLMPAFLEAADVHLVESSAKSA